MRHLEEDVQRHLDQFLEDAAVHSSPLRLGATSNGPFLARGLGILAFLASCGLGRSGLDITVHVVVVFVVRRGLNI